MLYLSASVEVQEWPHLHAVGGASSGPCEKLRVSVMPGIVATNLLQRPLFVAPVDAATAAAQPCALAAGATQPVLAAWRGGSLQQHCLLVAMRADLLAEALSAASAVAASEGASSAEAPENNGVDRAPGFAQSFVEFLEGVAGSQPARELSEPAPCSDPGGSSSIEGVGLLHVLSAHGRRSRLLLADVGGQVLAPSLSWPCTPHSRSTSLCDAHALVSILSYKTFVYFVSKQVHMITCRVLAAHGQLHIVLFRDPQPPVVIMNTCGVDTEVGNLIHHCKRIREAACRCSG